MRKRFAGVVLGTAVVVLLLIPAAGVAASSPSSAASSAKGGQFVIASSYGYKALVKARRAGVFKNTGLNVVIRPNSSKGAVAAVANGTADLAITDAGVVLYRAAKDSLDIRIVSGAEADAGKQYAVVGSGISDVSGLYQKRIAISGHGSLGQLATSVWLDNNGADSTSITWVSMAPKRLATAVSSGTADAAFGAASRLDGNAIGDPVTDAFGADAPTNVVIASSSASAATLKTIVADLAKAGFTTKLNMDALGLEATALLDYAYVDSAPDLTTLVWSGAPKS